ncbi:MAG: GNAT family N-acetyltransferase [Chloroflexi bacterium]|nr:GNAT family N-acetyltransferase [Chloroflexota bacterium]
MHIVKPILRDFPDTIETERLIIRPPQVGDGAALYDAVMESLDNLRPWMPWAMATPTIEIEEEVVRRARANWITREDLLLFVWRRDSGAFVGGTGLHRIDWSVPCFETGYWVRQSLEGQGYVTEAVRGVTRFAFEVLAAERMEIRCSTANVRSAAVARRAGYTLEATLRHNGRETNGQLRDTFVFGMLREEFKG